jgi:hypothetical protein
VVRSLLAHPLRLETVLYKFYNWEEHQRRHWRVRRAENEVCRAVEARCGNAGKYVLLCGGKRREIDCAVPRDEPVVAINVRVGVGEDRAKRIKEFAAELKEAKECGVKHFVVVYFVTEQVLGAERGLHLGASATTLCNVRLFSSRSAESLLLNPPDSRYQWQIDNSLWV